MAIVNCILKEDIVFLCSTEDELLTKDLNTDIILKVAMENGSLKYGSNNNNIDNIEEKVVSVYLYRTL